MEDIENKLKKVRDIAKGDIPLKGEILKALFNFHHEVGKILKNATNPFYKSKYADLNAFLDVIKEPLHNNNLLIVQNPISNGLETTIYHLSGQSISSKMEIEFPKDPQKIGSIITYFRRYMLQSMLFLNAEDDDGNSAKKAKDDDKINERNNILTEFSNLYTAIKNPSDSLKQFSKDKSIKTNFELRTAINKIKSGAK